MNMHEFQNRFQLREVEDSVLSVLHQLQEVGIDEAREVVMKGSMGWIVWDDPQPTDPFEPEPGGSLA